MIIDLEKFVRQEQPYWNELERLVAACSGRRRAIGLEQARRLHYLYERASADLARLDTFASNPALRAHLESIVARAYAQLHDTRQRTRLRPMRWLTQTFPQTFRAHAGAFWLSLGIMTAGVVLGAFLMMIDPEAPGALLGGPAAGLSRDADEIVGEWEQASAAGLEGRNAMFGFYIQNNVGVSIRCMVFGMTLGLGTLYVLFTNGAMVGAVFFKFIMAGHSDFVFGWLLPHGVPELSAIVLSGQAGLVLARALIGWGQRASLSQRMRAVAGPLTTLIAGVALLLVWAAALEAWLSQYHQPVLPYWAKITFGVGELIALYAFLIFAGRGRMARRESENGQRVRGNRSASSQ